MEVAASGRSSWTPPLRSAAGKLGLLLPGVAWCAAISASSLALAQVAWFRAQGMSALVIGMLCGAIAGNLLRQRARNRAQPGITFCRQRLLRLGIVLYGLRLTLGDVVHVGLPGVAADALILGSTFLLALAAGTRLLKMDVGTATLIGAGSAICGAAAILATEPVAKSRPEQVTVAVATIVLFGTIATLFYPWLYRMNLEWRILPVSPEGFGMYVGSTVHEVGQVVAAARLVDAEAMSTAVIAKMIRVMMLPVFLAVLPSLLAGMHRGGAGMEDVHRSAQEAKAPVPWFAFGFIGMIVFNSVLPLPHRMLEAAIDVDTLLLTMAMSALGAGTRLADFRRAGVKPVLLGAILFVWLVVAGAGINLLAMRLPH